MRVGRSKIKLSASQPAIQILANADAEDEMEVIINCPYCGKVTRAADTYMICGYVGCRNCYWTPVKGLKDVVLRLREKDYEAYRKGDFYKEGYRI